MNGPYRYLALGALLSLALLLIGCGQPAPEEAAATAASPPETSNAGGTTEPTYVGSEACAGCHAAAFDAWRGSHHDLALQIADEHTILGRFPAQHGAATFERDGDDFRVVPSTDDAPRTVLYTFGVSPLQQYVVPAEEGALQTFPTAWDSRPEAAGGQRWFELYPDDYPPGDPMHWTGRANRWNSHCADCHSTAVEKHYDAAAGSYATNWAVEDVGCEACHGPGSAHAADPTGARPATLVAQHDQINACAPCHSRRGQLAEGFRPDRSYFDHYAPRLLEPGLYHVDGQIDDEVYVYGSFLQSRMHRAGVTCSNCHDPHSGTLARPGNETCTFCHQSSPPDEFALLASGRYDDPAHHFHPPESTGAQCVACHMPSKTYMEVDDRRDHSFRIPRPDLAGTLGVPEPCTGCHTDRTPAWAAGVIDDHFGKERPPHFATTFARADRADPDADAALAGLVADGEAPIMVRASALARLGSYSRGYTMDSIRLARRGEPLLRLAAPLAAASLAPDTRWRLLAPLLDDALRAIRQQTVTALLPTLGADPAYRARLVPYLEVWFEEQSLNLDYPETRTNLAAARMALGQPAEAEAHLTEALRQQASWVPGLMNLADLYRATGRDPQAGELLAQALTLAPDAPEVAYGYGLWLSRQGRLGEGLQYLQQAASLAPDQRRYAYTWAIALNDSGDGEMAVNVLQSLLERWPEDAQLLLAVVTMLRDQGRFEEALPLLDRLIELRPGDAQLRQFRESLARAANAA